MERLAVQEHPALTDFGGDPAPKHARAVIEDHCLAASEGRPRLEKSNGLPVTVHVKAWTLVTNPCLSQTGQRSVPYRVTQLHGVCGDLFPRCDSDGSRRWINSGNVLPLGRRLPPLETPALTDSDMRDSGMPANDPSTLIDQRPRKTSFWPGRGDEPSDATCALGEAEID